MQPYDGSYGGYGAGAGAGAAAADREDAGARARASWERWVVELPRRSREPEIETFFQEIVKGQEALVTAINPDSPMEHANYKVTVAPDGSRDIVFPIQYPQGRELVVLPNAATAVEFFAFLPWDEKLREKILGIWANSHLFAVSQQVLREQESAQGRAPFSLEVQQDRVTFSDPETARRWSAYRLEGRGDPVENARLQCRHIRETLPELERVVREAEEVRGAEEAAPVNRGHMRRFVGLVLDSEVDLPGDLNMGDVRAIAAMALNYFSREPETETLARHFRSSYEQIPQLVARVRAAVERVDAVSLISRTGTVAMVVRPSTPEPCSGAEDTLRSVQTHESLPTIAEVEGTEALDMPYVCTDYGDASDDDEAPPPYPHHLDLATGH